MHEIASTDRGDLHAKMKRILAGCCTAFVLVLGVAFVAIWLGMKDAQVEARASLGWPAAPGTILESEVIDQLGFRATDERPTKRAGTTYRPRVRYEYHVAEVRHEGTRIAVFQTLDATREEAEARLAPYPVGAPVDVHHNPTDATRAVLEPGPETFDNTYFFAFGGGFLAILAALALVVRGILRTRST